MMARAHKLSGTLVATPTALIDALPVWVRIVTVPLATYAALVPDWDHHSSTITRGGLVPVRRRRRRFNPIKRWSKVRKSDPWTEWLADKLLIRFPFWVVSVHLRALSRLAQAATRAKRDRVGKSAHRMLTHTGLGCIGFGYLAWGLTRLVPGPIGHWSVWWGVVVFMGCLAHVLGDMLTPGGCPIWWPLKIEDQRWHMVSARLFKTDSQIERLMVVPILYFLIGFVAFTGALVFYDIAPVEAAWSAIWPG